MHINFLRILQFEIRYLHAKVIFSKVLLINLDPEAAEFAAIAEYFHRLAAAAAGKKFG
jgi:hypothetical protein